MTLQFGKNWTNHSVTELRPSVSFTKLHEVFLCNWGFGNTLEFKFTSRRMQTGARAEGCCPTSATEIVGAVLPKKKALGGARGPS